MHLATKKLIYAAHEILADLHGRDQDCGEE